MNFNWLQTSFSKNISNALFLMFPSYKAVSKIPLQQLYKFQLVATSFKRNIMKMFQTGYFRNVLRLQSFFKNAILVANWSQKKCFIQFIFETF